MDPVGDSLIRIKNGYLAGKDTVVLSYSKLILSICKLLSKEGYLQEVKDDKKSITVTLKYDGATHATRKAAVTDVKRISKPGLRVYKSRGSLPWVLNGLGIAIVSTPKGVLTDKQARKERVGGEVLAYVW